MEAKLRQKQEGDRAIEPLLEVEYPITPGAKLSSLHGYSLYAALKTRIPWIGDCPQTAISSIAGMLYGDKTIETHEFSRLRLRTPLSKASNFYALAGQTLSIGQGKISLGIPTIAPLRPKAALKARIVIIHLSPREEYPSRDRFLAVATRQLEERGIQGKLELCLRRGEPDTKVILIKQRKIPGYSLQVTQLSDEDSLTLQSLGLGGKRKMGAGFFQ